MHKMRLFALRKFVELIRNCRINYYALDIVAAMNTITSKIIK